MPSCKINIQQLRCCTLWRTTSYIHFLHISEKIKYLTRSVGLNVTTIKLAEYGSGHHSAVFTITLVYLKACNQMRLRPLPPLMSSALWVLGLVQQTITGHLYVSITADLIFNDISVSHIYNLSGWPIFIDYFC